MIGTALATLRAGGSIGARRLPPASPPTAVTLESASEPFVWRLAADLVPSAVLILDRTGHVLDANLAAARLAGAERASLQRRPLTDLVEPVDRPRAATTYQRPLQRRQGWRLSIRTPTSPTTVAFDCWPVRIGEEEGLVLIGHQLHGDRAVPSTVRVGEQGGLGDGEPAPT
ncbi:MAG TPA: PAS domain-containing protein [Candidatus Dormibacteraeota bacterium]|nr:PAS domain-containing protein [Candidatus Dormibacteraeota bacterium]